MYRVLLFLGLSICFASCGNDKKAAAQEEFVSEINTEEHSQDTEPSYSTELYARLDRLRIRSDSSMSAGTVVTIAERDTLDYLGAASDNRLALQLRSKYYYEPWLKVRHRSSGKTGWVYGGAVYFQSPKLKEQINANSSVYQQIHADDIEWDGTVPTSWSSATISNPIGFKIFLLNFKELVRKNEVVELSKLVKYPIRNLENRKQFEESYNRIFTKELREIIRTQRLDRIFRDTKGAAIGAGDLLFKEFNGQYRLVAIKFEGIEDVARKTMDFLSRSYNHNNQSIEVIRIREFLELRYKSSSFGQSESLGKYVFGTIRDKQFRFLQETKDSLKRELVFSDSGEFVDLQVISPNEPQLHELRFQAALEEESDDAVN